MIKKIFAKLVGYQDQVKNVPQVRHLSEQKDGLKLEHEIRAQELHDKERRYDSERVAPEVLGPSDSEIKQEK